MSEHEPIGLYGKNGGEPVAFICGACKRTNGVYSIELGAEAAADLARKHCAPKTCDECGARLSRLAVWCDSCAEKRRRLRIEEAWQKAKKTPLAEYPHDFLSAPELKDELFQSIDDLLDHCVEVGAEVPEIVFGCERLELYISGDDIVYSALEEHHEDAGEGITAAEHAELQTFLDGWCKRANVVTYREDRGLGIVIPQDMRDEVEA